MSARRLAAACGVGVLMGAFFMPAAQADPYYLHGFIVQYEPSPNVIDYPNSDLYAGRGIRQGVVNLDNRIGSLPPGSTVVGVSEGSIVVNEWLRQHAGDADAPSPDEVQFVLAAPPLLPGGLFYTVFPYGTFLPWADQVIRPVPVTQYDIAVVVHEYDGWGDFPKYWYVNPLAAVNAITGMFYQAHGTTPMDPAVYENSPHYTVTNEQGGTTTYYLAPNDVLPLTAPLRDIGVPAELVDAVDDVLRPVIDMGYDRSAYVGGPTNDVLATALSSPESSPEADTVQVEPAAIEPAAMLVTNAEVAEKSTVSDRKPSSRKPSSTTGTEVKPKRERTQQRVAGAVQVERSKPEPKKDRGQRHDDNGRPNGGKKLAQASER